MRVGRELPVRTATRAASGGSLGLGGAGVDSAVGGAAVGGAAVGGGAAGVATGINTVGGSGLQPGSQTVGVGAAVAPTGGVVVAPGSVTPAVGSSSAVAAALGDSYAMSVAVGAGVLSADSPEKHPPTSPTTTTSQIATSSRAEPERLDITGPPMLAQVDQVVNIKSVHPGARGHRA